MTTGCKRGQARWLEKVLVFWILLCTDFSQLPYKLGAIIGPTNLGICLKRGGSDLDGLSKQMQQWFLLSHWLKLTHTPLAGSTAFSGTARQ